MVRLSVSDANFGFVPLTGSVETERAYVSPHALTEMLGRGRPELDTSGPRDHYIVWLWSTSWFPKKTWALLLQWALQQMVHTWLTILPLRLYIMAWLG